MKANFCGRRFPDIYQGWYSAYSNVMEVLYELGIEICISPVLNMQKIPDYASVGIKDSDNDIYVYNHTHIPDIQKHGFKTGVKTFFIKPTFPSPEYFTLDSEGYAASSSITYKKPCFVGYDSTNFFSNTVPEIIKNRPNKWSDRSWCGFREKESLNIPKDHILIIGQVPNDETCHSISFGNHFDKLNSIVNCISHFSNVIVKLHPHLLDPAEDEEDLDTYTVNPIYLQRIEEWENKGVIVLKDYTSLYDVLPLTKVAIVENSTSGLECLMHKIPVISYGYPEYHWVTKDLRHLNKLPDYITDLSWYNYEEANSFIAWYFEKYLCSDYDSTKRRVLEIFAE